MGSVNGFVTRRRFLKGAASFATFAAAAAVLPWGMRKALAATPTSAAPTLGSLRELKHVVLIMQENRSFDHYFGMLEGVRGYGDPHPQQLGQERSVFYQPDAANPDGYLLPFHLNTHTTRAQMVPSTDHSWVAQHASWNHGNMDGFVSGHLKFDGTKGQYVMGYYDRSDIPFHYALADAFTVCDAYHCSVIGPTWPNRCYWMSGTIDPQGRHGGPYITGEPLTGLTWTTYPERLEKAGVSWKVYRTKEAQNERFPYGSNVLTMFKQYMDAPHTSPLYRKGGIGIVSTGQFEYDAMHDKLPAVSWIIPRFHETEHPHFMPATGAAFLASVLDAIASSPDVWASTAVFIMYDENDGLFDHVAPTTPPPGTPLEFVDGQPIGAGFRVPCIVVSPWTVGGWVCSEPFDHTSQLQFLERFTGVREPNITPWRRAHFGDMTSVFRFAHAAVRTPNLPRTGAVLKAAEYAATILPEPPIPGQSQLFPEQPRGSRKRVA